MIFAYQQKQIHYHVHGEGIPLVLLNGIMMSTSSWDVFNDRFKGFKRITLDFYDQGKSADHIDTYTIQDQASLLDALLSELDLQSIHLAGISYGGEVAIAFASKYPSKVLSLNIFNSAIHTDETLYQLGLHWLKLTKNKEGQAFYDATIPNIYGRTFKEKNKSWMEARANQLRDIFSNEHFLSRIHRLTLSSQHTDLRKDAKNITCPTQIISGLEDTLIPVKYQKEILNYIPHASHIELPNIGHATMYEDSETFENLITNHIKNIIGGKHEKETNITE